MNLALLLNILLQRRGLMSHVNWEPEKVQAYNMARLKKLREYVYANSDFYKHFHANHYSENLDSLPILTKPLIMENFDDLVTDKNIKLNRLQEFIKNGTGELFNNRYWVTATSGTSGTPGIFVQDFSEWSEVIASYSRGFALGGMQPSLFNKTKIAFVSTTFLLHQSALVGKSIESPFLPTLRLDATEPIDEIIDKLNIFQPDTLVSYASMAALLAEKQLSGILRINPKTIFTSSEVLTAEMRNTIKAAWRTEPFNQYASTEVGGLGIECKMHNGLHLFNDLVITEIVDEDNKPVPPGSYGNKLLVTVLFNKTQPLIRYQLNDSIKISNVKCPCGISYPLIEEIQGRSDQIIYLVSKDNKRIAVHPALFSNIMDYAGVTRWQVILEKEQFTFLIITAEVTEITSVINNKMKEAFDRLNVQLPHLNIQPVSELPKTTRGKLTLIVNKL